MICLTCSNSQSRISVLPVAKGVQLFFRNFELNLRKSLLRYKIDSLCSTTSWSFCLFLLQIAEYGPSRVPTPQKGSLNKPPQRSQSLYLGYNNDPARAQPKEVSIWLLSLCSDLSYF